MNSNGPGVGGDGHGGIGRERQGGEGGGGWGGVALEYTHIILRLYGMDWNAYYGNIFLFKFGKACDHVTRPA